MKHLSLTLSLILSLLFPVSLFAKTKNNSFKKVSRTQLERFFSEKGAIVIIETKFIGSAMIRNSKDVYIKLYAVILYLPGRDDKVLKGIKIDAYSIFNQKLVTTAYIDSSELPSLYRAIMYILKSKNNFNKLNKNIHITYITKGDFSVGYIHKNKKKNSYYYRIKDTENGKIISNTFQANQQFLRRLKKLIRKGVSFLNKHKKKIKKPKKIEKATKELNT